MDEKLCKLCDKPIEINRIYKKHVKYCKECGSKPNAEIRKLLSLKSLVN